MKLLALTATILAATGSAHAQPAASAEVLFRDGTKAMAAGRIEEACTAFEGSQHIDPNISTLINLADCREKNRQLATAWSLFLQAAREAQGEPDFADLLELARKRADQLEQRLSHLVISVPAEGGVADLVITRNGVPIDRAEWNRAIPVDGGNIAVEAKAHGHEPWSKRITVSFAGDNASVDVPRFRPITPPVDRTNEGDESSEPETSRPFLSRRRIIALSLGGASLLAIGGGLGFELSARSTYRESIAEPNRERQTSLYETAQTRRYVAGGLAVVGVGAAVAATYLWLTGVSADRDAVVLPSVGQSQIGLAITGGF